MRRNDPDVHSTDFQSIVIAPGQKPRLGAFLFLTLLGILPWPTLFVLMRVGLVTHLHKPITISEGEIALLLGLMGGTVLLFGLMSFTSAHSDRILGWNRTTGNVVFAKRYMGEPTFISKFAYTDVVGISIHWQATYLGDEPTAHSNDGWWMAGLTLSSGQSIHLHGIRGKKAAPPTAWLTRLKQASELLERPLQMIPTVSGIRDKSTYAPPVSRLVNNLHQRPVVSDKVSCLVLLASLMLAMLMLSIYLVIYLKLYPH
jgi:hypothetical protein